MPDIEIPFGEPHAFDDEIIEVEGEKLRLWPQGVQIGKLVEPKIFGVRFDDAAAFGELTELILAEAQRLKENSRGLGGKKVRDLATWDSPAGKLLTRRALLFYCRAFGASNAHVVDRWANVSEKYEYSAPHAHYEAEASAVFYLDLGDPTPEFPWSGAFELIDPRIPYCCSQRPGFPTRGLQPKLTTGTMLGFPANLLHLAHPYQGQRPRITLVWNMSPGRTTPEREARLTQQVAAGIG